MYNYSQSIEDEASYKLNKTNETNQSIFRGQEAQGCVSVCDKVASVQVQDRKVSGKDG